MFEKTFKFESNPVYINAEDQTWVHFYTLTGEYIDYNVLSDNRYWLDTQYIGHHLVCRIEPFIVDDHLDFNERLSKLETLLNHKSVRPEPVNTPVINGHQTKNGSILITDKDSSNLTAAFITNSSQSFRAGLWIPVYADYIYTTDFDLNLLDSEGGYINKELINGDFYKFNNAKGRLVLCIT